MTNHTKYGSNPRRDIAPVDTVPKPPLLATMMVARSHRRKSRAAGLAEFHAKFAQASEQLADLDEARNWAYCYGWERLYMAYKPMIDIGMILLTILSFLLGFASFLI